MATNLFRLFRFCQRAFLLAMFFVTSITSAQSLKLDPNSCEITISGTTNVHNFVSKVTQVNTQFLLDDSRHPKFLSIEIPVKSIKSGDKLMDSKTYETFNCKSYPNINFKLTHIKSSQVVANVVTVVFDGVLTMAGVSNKVSILTNGQILKLGIYNFKGSVRLKMSDYKMKPPTAMMGLMKVGDEVVVNYNFIFEGDVVFN